MNQGSGILAKETALFLATPKLKARTGLDFSPQKNPVPSRRPSGAAWSDFFSHHGRAGTGLDFLFRGRGRDWIFFAGRPARGRDRIFYFADGTGFFALQLGSDDEVPW